MRAADTGLCEVPHSQRPASVGTSQAGGVTEASDTTGGPTGIQGSSTTVIGAEQARRVGSLRGGSDIGEHAQDKIDEESGDQFLVKWKGYELRRASWEEESYLDDCAEAMRAWRLQFPRPAEGSEVYMAEPQAARSTLAAATRSRKRAARRRGGRGHQKASSTSTESVHGDVKVAASASTGVGDEMHVSACAEAWRVRTVGGRHVGSKCMTSTKGKMSEV